MVVRLFGQWAEVQYSYNLLYSLPCIKSITSKIQNLAIYIRPHFFGHLELGLGLAA